MIYYYYKLLQNWKFLVFFTWDFPSTAMTYQNSFNLKVNTFFTAIKMIY